MYSTNAYTNKENWVRKEAYRNLNSYMTFFDDSIGSEPMVMYVNL